LLGLVEGFWLGSDNDFLPGSAEDFGLGVVGIRVGAGVCAAGIKIGAAGTS